MADEIDLEKVIKRINSTLGCNIKLETPNDEIHFFIDSYDEGYPGEIVKSVEKNEYSIIENYFKKLMKWRRRFIIISCRTDFVQNEGDDILSEFRVWTIKAPTLRYIAPILYKASEQNVLYNNKSNFDILVREWLKREEIKNKSPEKIISRLKNLQIDVRMKTGLMFNMIMKIIVSTEEEESVEDMRLKGFEIFRRITREEFKDNWKEIISRGGSGK